MEGNNKKYFGIIGNGSAGLSATVAVLAGTQQGQIIIHSLNENMSTDNPLLAGNALGKAANRAAGAAVKLSEVLVEVDQSTPGYRPRRRKGSNVATNVDRQKQNERNRRHKANKAARRARKKNRR